MPFSASASLVSLRTPELSMQSLADSEALHADSADVHQGWAAPLLFNAVQAPKACAAHTGEVPWLPQGVQRRVSLTPRRLTTVQPCSS